MSLPKLRKPRPRKPRSLRLPKKINEARLAEPDHYRCQVQMPRKWIYAVGHHFLLKALDTNIAVELRDCFGAKIEARYLAHLKTALSTPEARAKFREFMELNVEGDTLRQKFIRDLGALLDIYLYD